MQSTKMMTWFESYLFNSLNLTDSGWVSSELAACHIFCYVSAVKKGRPRLADCKFVKL